ncbi:MAG: GNAT family N-acetyltransferase [Pseudomonadota bacterium]
MRNKTSDVYRAWIANEKLIKIVVEREEAIAGFGMAATDGEVLLNYVSPEFRFAGVSRLVLEEIERSLVNIGIEEARLWSTETAHTFYQSRGWVDRGNPEEEDGMLSYPMWKSLAL